MSYCVITRKETRAPSESKSGRVDGVNSSITPREMEMNAGTAFRGGRSKTAHLHEFQRVQRKHPKFGYPLPAEDAVERVQAKVAEFGAGRLVAR